MNQINGLQSNVNQQILAYSSMDKWQGMSKGVMAMACCICCSMFALILTYVISMGIYAFNNPDKEAWIGEIGGE